MLSIDGLGDAGTTLWSMSTGGCSGGAIDVQCRPWSGSAGKAYNCTGCGTANQNTIASLQLQMQHLIALYGLSAQFGAGKFVVADKAIGLNTARAVGLLGRATLDRGLGASPGVIATVVMCESQKAALEAQAVTQAGVQMAIQAVAKYTPALLAWFQAAAQKFGGNAVPVPDLPEPPAPPPTEPPIPVPVVDFKLRPRLMWASGLLFLGLTGAILYGTSRVQQKRRGR